MSTCTAESRMIKLTKHLLPQAAQEMVFCQRGADGFTHQGLQAVGDALSGLAVLKTIAVVVANAFKPRVVLVPIKVGIKGTAQIADVISDRQQLLDLLLGALRV